MGVQFNNNKLVELQATNKLTQFAISKILGITPQQYRKKVTSKVDFKVSEICRLADLFKVEPGIFFTSSVDNIST